MATTSGFRPDRPRGFTLVELLVVIGIIGTVMAIAVPTIFGAIASARNAKTKAEIDMLHMALMNYKNEYGSFPPANMAGLWSGSSVNTGHAAYKHLVRIFPRLSEATSGAGSPYYTMARMSPAQALVFWLQGFYQNPQYPITNGGAPGTRQKLFDFDESRLYAASMPYSFSAASPQTFAPRSSSAPSAEEKACPVYFTGHPSCGLPYVYFDSRCYDNVNVMDSYYVATSVNGDASIAYPYINAVPPTNPTWGQMHCAGETFQIIAAGKDGKYGPDPTVALGTAQAAFPRSTGTQYTFTFVDGTGTLNAYTRPYADDVNTTPGHADNLANFADRSLADAIEAQKSQ